MDRKYLTFLQFNGVVIALIFSKNNYLFNEKLEVFIQRRTSRDVSWEMFASIINKTSYTYFFSLVFDKCLLSSSLFQKLSRFSAGD